MSSYRYNLSANLSIVRNQSFSLELIKNAILKFNDTIKKIFDADIDISVLLGMRNLSSFVGEVFAASIISCSNKKFNELSGM